MRNKNAIPKMFVGNFPLLLQAGLCAHSNYFSSANAADKANLSAGWAIALGIGVFCFWELILRYADCYRRIICLQSRYLRSKFLYYKRICLLNCSLFRNQSLIFALERPHLSFLARIYFFIHGPPVILPEDLDEEGLE